MTWLALAVLGGIVGLDATSVAQAMISRPLVAGALTGALLGSPIEGILVGAILEVFDLAILPIGAARYPEGGTAAVAAAAGYIAAAADSATMPGMLLIAVVFGLAWERLAGTSVVLTRRANEALLHAGDPSDARSVERRHLLAIVADFVRGAGVTVVGAAAGSVLIAALGPVWAIGAPATLAILVFAGVVVLAGVLSLFGGWTERRNVFLLGVLCGSMVVMLLRS